LRQLSEALTSNGPTDGTSVWTIDINAPADAASSHHHGRLLQIRHELKVKLKTGFLTNSPCITQPISLVNPVPTFIPQALLSSVKWGQTFQLPPGWAPHVAPMVTIPPIDCKIVGHVGSVEGTYAVPTAPPVSYNGHVQAVQGGMEGAIPANATIVSASAAVQEYHGGTVATGKVADVCAEVVGSVPAQLIVVTATPSVVRTVSMQHVQPVGNGLYTSGGQESLRTVPTVTQQQLDELHRQFSSIPSMAGQLRHAEVAARRLKCLTCAQVASAAAGTMDGGKGQVVRAMLQTAPLVDRENAHLIREQLSPAAWAGVERYLDMRPTLNFAGFISSLIRP
jgi:hypothetical protein